MTVLDIHPSRLSLGTKVSVITGAQYRYEGTVAAINSIEGTLTLQNVCFWGLENRIPQSPVNQSSEKKPPAVGSIFNLITFWMSSIIQVWLPNDGRDEKNDIGDRGIAKAGTPVDMNRGRGRRPRSWWQAGDQQRTALPMNDTTSRRENMNHIPQMNRYEENMAHPGIQNQPRMLVSYPRRGRNSAIYPRHTGYVPVVPVVQGPGGMRRSGYSANTRSPTFRGMTTPVPPGARMGGNRRSGPPMRHMLPSGDEYRYNQAMLNSAGGVLVYLPPDMAAAYQSHGINFVPSRPPRRRMGERRNASRGPEATEPEIDCTTPYDFEAANAEFKEELEKITINDDGVPVTIGSQQSTESNARPSDSSTTTSDSQTSTLRSPSSTVSAAVNGASGDSTRGPMTGHDDSRGTTAEGNGPLAKGEYYVREKCFFDQISRPESGPRSAFGGENSRNSGYRSAAGGQNRRLGYGSGFNSFTAARRERQLNMETFGSIAARTTFIPRRRGPPPRDYLVTAPA